MHLLIVSILVVLCQADEAPVVTLNLDEVTFDDNNVPYVNKIVSEYSFLVGQNDQGIPTQHHPQIAEDTPIGHDVYGVPISAFARGLPKKDEPIELAEDTPIGHDVYGVPISAFARGLPKKHKPIELTEQSFDFTGYPTHEIPQDKIEIPMNWYPSQEQQHNEEIVYFDSPVAYIPEINTDEKITPDQEFEVGDLAPIKTIEYQSNDEGNAPSYVLNSESPKTSSEFLLHGLGDTNEKLPEEYYSHLLQPYQDNTASYILNSESSSEFLLHGLGATHENLPVDSPYSPTLTNEEATTSLGGPENTGGNGFFVEASPDNHEKIDSLSTFSFKQHSEPVPLFNKKGHPVYGFGTENLYNSGLYKLPLA